MTGQQSAEDEGRIERARRLRKQIQDLKENSGQRDEGAGSENGKSLKEQVENRAAQQKGACDTDGPSDKAPPDKSS